MLDPLTDLLQRIGSDVPALASKLRELVKLMDTIGVADEVVPIDLGVPQLTPGANHWQRSAALYWSITAPGEEQSITFSLDDFLPRGAKVTGAKLSYATNASYVTGDVEFELIVHDSIGVGDTATQSSVAIAPSATSLTTVRTALPINTRLLMCDGKETMLRVRYTVARALAEFRVIGLTVTYTYTNRPQPFPLTRLVAIAAALAAGAPTSTLQPLNYSANIVAAYALNEPAAACNTDRSGNGKDFTATRLASDMANAYDLIPGKACIWSTGPYGTAPVQCRQTDNVWGIFGEITIAHRVFISVPETGAPGLAEHCFGQSQGTPAGTASVAFQWGIIGNGASPHCLYYFAETAAKGAIPFISTLFVSPNTWHFITVRRRADNSVRLGVDGVYQDSGALAAPGTAVANPRYLALCAHQDDTVPIAGGMADLIVWNRSLTDDELWFQQLPAMRGKVG